MRKYTARRDGGVSERIKPTGVEAQHFWEAIARCISVKKTLSCCLNVKYRMILLLDDIRQKHKNGTDNQWGRALLTDEISGHIYIWKEQETRNNPPNIIDRDRFEGHNVLVWGGIMLGCRTNLHIFEESSVIGACYCNEIILPYVRPFTGAVGWQFLFMDGNVPYHRTVAVE
ncbi:transposable element Tcb2 transposase [Trichonephila clavipes]|nr:transposable element Tcb2 transposase [Trichonephila clavipes]